MRKITTLFILLLTPVSALGQQAELTELAKLKAQVKLMQENLAKLESVITAQQIKIEQLSKTTVSAPVATAAPTNSRGNAQIVAPFNPEIGIVADITAISTQSDEDLEGNDKISVRELEFIFGHAIDPYSRLDATITFSDLEDPDIEEAYVSYWDLPWGIKSRIGRMRPKIGIASAMHRDSLETVDEPLVVQRYLGHEGLFRTGVELSTFIPSPWDTPTHEIIGGIMEGGIGEEGTLFGETTRRPSYYARLKNSYDISDETLLNFGTTFLLGSADEDSANESRAVGLDLALTHNFGPIRKLKLQTEAYLQDRSAPAIESDHHGEDEAEVEDADVDESDDFDSSPWGLYALADYRASERWSFGARWDMVEPVNLEDGNRSDESAYSAYLTFHQSEFARWRFQYQYAEPLVGDADNRFFLQGTFAIGVHKHKIQ